MGVIHVHVWCTQVFSLSIFLLKHLLARMFNYWLLRIEQYLDKLSKSTTNSRRYCPLIFVACFGSQHFESSVVVCFRWPTLLPGFNLTWYSNRRHFAAISLRNTCNTGAWSLSKCYHYPCSAYFMLLLLTFMSLSVSPCMFVSS